MVAGGGGGSAAMEGLLGVACWHNFGCCGDRGIMSVSSSTSVGLPIYGIRVQGRKVKGPHNVHSNRTGLAIFRTQAFCVVQAQNDYAVAPRIHPLLFHNAEGVLISDRRNRLSDCEPQSEGETKDPSASASTPLKMVARNPDKPKALGSRQRQRK